VVHGLKGNPMQCPKCRNTRLQASKVEDGLPAMGCPACAGSLLSLLYYRDWVERNEPPVADGELATEVVEEADAKMALACPKCSGLMTKFSVSGALASRIDLCGRCDEAWLDGGEWQLLKSLELAHKLPAVFTEQWQRRVRSEKMAQLKRERLEQQVGAADATRAAEIKGWLAEHPQRATLLQFLASD